VLLATGCNRQDAECLSRIGSILSSRAQELRKKTETKSGLVQALPDLGGSGEGVGQPQPAGIKTGGQDSPP